MNIEIYELVEGAKQARGLTVIIDVFRAFSLECYLFARGAKIIYPVGSLDDAWAMKKADPNILLIGERKGKKVEGFDFGNSPSQTDGFDFSGRSIAHTTSAGTQGVANAVNADQIITGSLVNARAIANYIRHAKPDFVSLVAMGENAIRRADEDVICAEYIRAMLLDEDYPIDERIAGLRTGAGAKFFVEETQEIFPAPDFGMCIARDKFDFVIRIARDESGRNISQKIDI